jgi:hypothetical protein
MSRWEGQRTADDDAPLSEVATESLTEMDELPERPVAVPPPQPMMRSPSGPSLVGEPHILVNVFDPTGRLFRRCDASPPDRRG